LRRRPELEGIYGKLSGANGGKFDLAGFIKFMKEYQKANSILSTYSIIANSCFQSTLDDVELTSIFHKYAGKPASPNESLDTMSLEGFSTFLISPENSAFSEQNRPIWQDMTQPLSDYFISSSHNTYLVGHQLVGVSTIEGYIRALLHSCRSVECQQSTCFLLLLSRLILPPVG
jgi:phosphatidylinositol phospholipase C delta